MKSVGTIIAMCGVMIISFIIGTPKCLATTWYVDVNGSDSHAGTSSSTAFATLYEAVYKAAAGDTIDVDSGTYNLNYSGGGNTAQGNPVTVNTSDLTIQTTPGESDAILTGNYAPNGEGGGSGGLWLGTGDNIDLNGSNIVFQNLIVEGADVDGICIPNGSYDTVQYCTVSGCAWAGIMIGSTASTAQLSHDAILNCTACNLQYNTVYHNWGEGIGMYSFGQTTSGNWVDDNVSDDNWSCEVYICNSQYDYLWNNLIYADSNAILRPLEDGISFPAIGIASDNENASQNLDYGSQIFNNIVIGGQNCFRAANENTYSGFYPGGLNGYEIYNNVFYNTSPYNTSEVDPACVQVDNDPGNNFTWENNIVWETNGIAAVATDGGGGNQVKVTNCWDGTGGFNMNGPFDVLLSNENPGFADAGGTSAADYMLSTSSELSTTGTNAYSLFTFDFNDAARPSSGAWTMGAFTGASLTSTTTTLASSLNPSTYGKSVKFTATVSPTVPNGETVTFYNGGASIGTGTTSNSKATLAITSLPIGRDSITAKYAGDSEYATSTSSALAQTVNKPPTSIPAAPTGLSAVAGNGRVTLTWNASAGATSYNTYRSTTSGKGYAKIGAATTTTYTDSSVTNGKTYYYVVTAVDSAGASGYSNQASATPAAPTPPSIPAAPTGLSAAAGNARVTLTWSASERAASYDVYRSTTRGSGYAKIGPSATLAYTDSSVTNGKTYYYVVTAVDSAGASGYSNVASATPMAPAAPVIASFPAGVNFISLPYDYSSVSLSSVLGYSDPILAVWSPTASSYILSPNSPADRIRLGVGYWVRFPQAVSVTLMGAPASATGVAINLSPGWNQIGDPYPASVALSGVDVASGFNDDSYADAVSAGLIGPVLYRYDTGTNAYETVGASGSLEPCSGYFIDATASVTLQISHP